MISFRYDKRPYWVISLSRHKVTDLLTDPSCHICTRYTIVDTAVSASPVLYYGLLLIPQTEGKKRV
jgi:hypothetical protein